jgi:hypothetical protein
VQKANPADNTLHAFTWTPGPPIEEFARIFAADHFIMPQKELTAAGWQLEDQTTLRLLDKLRRAGQPLGEYVNGRFYYGIKTGYNEAFVVDRATRDRLIAEDPASAEILKPFLRGRDVKRWVVEFAEQYLIKIESSENKKHPWSDQPAGRAEEIFAKTYPAVYRRFQQHRAALINRQDQGKYFWELRSCKYWQEFEQPKIAYPDIAQSSEFAFDDKGYHLVNTLYLLPTNQKWLLALLNSNVVFWFYTKVSTQIRGGFVRFIAQYVSQIPIPAATVEQQAAIESLVAQILAAKQANPAANVAALEAEIDALVYRLYGLTEEEIAVVEGREKDL